MASIKFSFDSNKFKRDLEKAMKSETSNALQNRYYDVTCPHCKREFETKPGSHSCPYCGQVVNLKLNINF